MSPYFMHAVVSVRWPIEVDVFFLGSIVNMWSSRSVRILIILTALGLRRERSETSCAKALESYSTSITKASKLELEDLCCTFK